MGTNIYMIISFEIENRAVHIGSPNYRNVAALNMKRLNGQINRQTLVFSLKLNKKSNINE